MSNLTYDIPDHFGRLRARVLIDPVGENPSVILFDEKGNVVACASVGDTEATVLLYEGDRVRSAVLVPYHGDNAVAMVTFFNDDGTPNIHVKKAGPQ